MLKRIATVSALVCLVATTSFAQKTPGIDSNTKSISIDDFRGATPSPAEAGDTVDVDLSGVTHWDLDDGFFGILDPDNLATVMTIPVGSGDFNGVGWDTITSSVGLSWGSEATIGFDTNSDGIMELQLTPSTTAGVVAAEANSSMGVLKLIDAGIDPIPVTGATIDLYFYESYDDNADAIDAVYEAGSVLTLQTAVPEPTSLGLLFLAGLSFLGLRRRS